MVTKLTFANPERDRKLHTLEAARLCTLETLAIVGYLPLGLGGISGVMIKPRMLECTACSCEEEEEASNEGGYGYTSIQGDVSKDNMMLLIRELILNARYSSGIYTNDKS